MLKKIKSSFSEVDIFFLHLRLITILGGAIWIAVVSLDAGKSQLIKQIFIAFVLYSAILYSFIIEFPSLIRKFYIIAITLDMFFIYGLVRYIGELKGNYFLAFYLLVAIASFYFGLKTGLLFTFISSSLYIYCYIIFQGHLFLSWQDLGLRLIFLLLIAVSMGLLSENEKKDKENIKRLNKELSDKNSVLEQIYSYLSIGKLASGVAHSINNPLGIIAGKSENLLKEAKKDQLLEKFIKDLDAINKNTYQISEVTKSLLSLSAQDNLELKPVNLNDIIESTLILFENQFEQKGIKLKKNLSKNLKDIMGYSQGIKELLINLLNNAIDATIAGGNIEVSTDIRDGFHVILKVADDGAGIPKENIERIYDPFFTTKRNERGIGLGLTTCLRLIKRHNGLIEVNSKEGEGTTFTVSFPIY
ncbi:MAG: hypothetical protein A3H37_12350 [Candidatus Schekmanbacteria bacterium RIFCSPLOWO2_02_FULL_38_14]|uniref:histidine kinase n=1 Tax=Candidatus Schekmanbacteria bacterium RIFCSPLOWO2_12_FULL_38_15 TaxID=1817883 RepID=A0A1F7SDJ0_9BACT|nr:MAG: hypothetical protein A3H37_12350 [Candidatus Schekmanbacteria bacterium RIFCSPLOWO2_02_FULL_38_14]OGL51846.1 MAG: hypothetical protein A3G31_12755 [Candidatus Schekmanbacteria bacterium RIFCSPLOWO2_12_FULL_38_15]